MIKKAPASEEIICVLELKNPAFDPFHEEELIEPARKKANKRKAPYFATSNFQELIWFDTKRVNNQEPLEKQIVQRYTLSSMTDPDSIEEPGIKGAIRRGLERFLLDLAEVSTGRKAEPRHPIDEILVYRLQNTIKTLAIHYKRIIEEKIKNDRKFSKQLQTWFIEQGWTFSFQDHDFAKAARQTAYLLVNKILFYSVIQPIRQLDPLEIPKSLKKGKKSNEGINLDLLAQNVLSRLAEVNLATFYRERIATVPCHTLNLPKQDEPIEIENSLLGWQLKIGKKVMDCSSEAEARYLRMFAEMGWDHAPVPQDDGYLSSIINQWEDLFEQTQSALEEHTVSILQRKIRDRLAHEVWMKIRENMEKVAENV